MHHTTLDSFGAQATLVTGSGPATYYSLRALERAGAVATERLPFSLRVLAEALLRNEDGVRVTAEHVAALASVDPRKPTAAELPFLPARVLLQDFTGVPAVVDLAAMRQAMHRLGGDPQRINPVIPVDLVVDHSVQIDRFGAEAALAHNAKREFERNGERYAFLRWGQQAFRDFRVVPPASGICHQVNLEHLGRVVQQRQVHGRTVVFPDSLVGTDSHTPMINGLGVVGWGVGGIEAEAVMLGQPLYMLTPAVVGFKLSGQLSPGATATDLVLTVVQRLRAHGVVGKFVEFFGSGLSSMSVPDRATIANMAPEYGATVGYFPVDARTLQYLRATRRPPELVELVERYTKEQGLFRTDETPDPSYEHTLELDLATVRPSLAGPSRPQDRISLADMGASFKAALSAPHNKRGFGLEPRQIDRTAALRLPGGDQAQLGHGAVAIAAITSCTNTSNPSVMLAAGLLARNAVEAGLQRRRWVKTSLAPGSKVVTRYLDRAGLTPYLQALGFHTVGYGCTTCIGNSGPLPKAVADAIDEHGLVAASVLSGNRNFEGRINPRVRASYLASPPLVVAYALAGRVDLDLTKEPLGYTPDGVAVSLADIWPDDASIAAALEQALDPEDFATEYGDIERSNPTWNAVPVAGDDLYGWASDSTYIQEPPFFVDMPLQPAPLGPITGARVLVKVGDSVTTDHISPAGAIASDSPAGRYLLERGVAQRAFNSYGSRRGNDQIMTRGTFANIRLRNEMAPGTEGGLTTHVPSGERLTIYDAAERYAAEGVPGLVIAGRDYGMGSSRDWAAKGTLLLGVRAVIAVSYERIHRSNLVGMGVLPLQFEDGQDAASLGLSGHERFDIPVDDSLQPGQRLTVRAISDDGRERSFDVRCRLDSAVDVQYYRNGGILQTVLRGFVSEG